MRLQTKQNENMTTKTISEKKLREAIRKIKSDSRWNLPWNERHGDVFHPDTPLDGFSGYGYQFPFSKGIGKAIDKRNDEGFFVSLFFNGIETNVKVTGAIQSPDGISYPDIAATLETIFGLE